MTKQRLEELAEAVGQLSEPDRETDCMIGVAVGRFHLVDPPKYGGPDYGYTDSDGGEVRPGHGGDQLVPRYTASLDAAMTLVPEGSVWFVGNSDDPSPAVWNACVMPEQAPADRWTRAATPALALCAASLRARAASMKEGTSHE